jgi:hypothetical protein
MPSSSVLEGDERRRKWSMASSLRHAAASASSPRQPHPPLAQIELQRG